nr:MAG TPA: hypothetical protein [Caudoviricetes sp.]
MACISKLASAIAYDCDTGATGLVSAIIINKADIASFTVTQASLSVDALALTSGAKAYKIDTVKRSLVMSEALKINEGAPNAYTHTANITIMGENSTAIRNIKTAATNGSFVILAKKQGDTFARAYGLYCGMSATSADSSTHDNGGWTTLTLETPENVIGEDTLSVGSSLYDALYAAAVG